MLSKRTSHKRLQVDRKGNGRNDTSRRRLTKKGGEIQLNSTINDRLMLSKKMFEKHAIGGCRLTSNLS